MPVLLALMVVRHRLDDNVENPQNQAEFRRKNMCTEQTPIPAIKLVNRPRGNIKYLFAKRYIDGTVSCRSACTESERQRKRRGSNDSKKGTKRTFFRVDFVYDLWALRAAMSNKLSPVFSVRPWRALMLSSRFRRTNYLCSRHTDKFSHSVHRSVLCCWRGAFTCPAKMAYGNIYNLVHPHFPLVRCSDFVLFFTKRIILWKKHVWCSKWNRSMHKDPKNMERKNWNNSPNIGTTLTPLAIECVCGSIARCFLPFLISGFAVRWKKRSDYSWLHLYRMEFTASKVMTMRAFPLRRMWRPPNWHIRSETCLCRICQIKNAQAICN